jgi:hypothetical protein
MARAQIIADGARGDAYLVFEISWRCKDPLGIEAPFYPSPIDGFIETATKYAEEAMFAHR